MTAPASRHRQGGSASRRSSDLPRRPRAGTMTEYRVIATDEVQPALAGHDGLSYQSLPQTPRARARARPRTGRAPAAPRRARTVAPRPARRHPHRPNRAGAMTATAQPKTATDAQALDSYLRMLAGPAPGARLLEIRFALRYRDMGRLFIAAHSAPGASRLIRRLAARTDVYVGVCLRTRRAGGRDAIDRSHLAFVEIDTPDALDRLRAFRHPPSMIVSSGSAGHAHAYFTLSAPVTVPELERANRRLAHALGGDLASVDAARILRPPSSWNHKHSPPAPVELIELDQARRYDLDQLVDGLDDPPGRPSVSTTDTPQNRPHRDRPAAPRDPRRRIRARAHRPLPRPHRQDPLPVPRRPHAQPPALRGRHVVLLRSMQGRRIHLRLRLAPVADGHQGPRLPQAARAARRRTRSHSPHVAAARRATVTSTGGEHARRYPPHGLDRRSAL